ISRTLTKHIATVLFLGFGLWSLWDAFHDGESEELAEVEAELVCHCLLVLLAIGGRMGGPDADLKASSGATRANGKADDDAKKKSRPFFSQFFSPIFLKAFSITFFGEWGDKSQIATIGLAAAENPLGVVLGGILIADAVDGPVLLLTEPTICLATQIGQALCQTAAVFGGKSLATQISEKFIALSGGVLFIVFGIQSFFATVE
ncbi:GDT1-like protein 4, partial [Tanacetum coccineum]